MPVSWSSVALLLLANGASLGDTENDTSHFLSNIDPDPNHSCKLETPSELTHQVGTTGPGAPGSKNSTVR